MRVLVPHPFRPDQLKIASAGPGVPVRTLDSAKEKTANAGPSWKGIRKFI